MGAFYKNDRPGGLGFEMECDDDLPGFLETTARQYDEVVQKTPSEVKFYFDQLASWGAALSRGELSEDLQMAAIINIYWLESRGHLKSDEYNGMVWAYAGPESPSATNRKDRRAARAAARRSGPIPMTAEELHEGRLDRKHLYEHNVQEALRRLARASADDGKPAGEYVAIICDSRDKVARGFILASGMDELKLRQFEAQCVMGKMTPTIHLTGPRRHTIDAIIPANPGLSEQMEQAPADHICVLVIASKGTSLVVLPPDQADSLRER